MEKKKNITSKIKAEIVLSLLRGEDIELFSRKYGVTLSDINHWRDQFIESGIEGFKRKPDDSKLSAAERKIGQLQMELELTKKKERINSKAKKEMISMLIKERYSLTGKPYPKRLIFKVVGYSSSTWYENPTPKTGKRGRKSSTC